MRSIRARLHKGSNPCVSGGLSCGVLPSFMCTRVALELDGATFRRAVLAELAKIEQSATSAAEQIRRKHTEDQGVLSSLALGGLFCGVLPAFMRKRVALKLDGRAFRGAALVDLAKI